MTHTASAQLSPKAAGVRALLTRALGEHGRLVYANSLGAEAMVLTDLIGTWLPAVDMFTIDTGRLHEETHALLARLERRYPGRIRVLYPDAGETGRLVARRGVNGFYGSLEARLDCCRVRKVEPFRRAIAGYGAWVTGVRREQSASRAQAEPVEWDARYGLYKLSPLLDWTEEEVWAYIREHQLPYNPLHDRGYPSIGCQPCTRALQPGESRRAGRWWWEQAEHRECGLQPRAPVIAAPPRCPAPA